MNKSKGMLSSSNSQISVSSKQPRKFSLEDIPAVLDKIFSQYDTDGNKLFSIGEFTKVIKSIMNLLGGECPNQEDVYDLFNLIDINGDETVNKEQLTSLLTVFFKLLK